MGFKMPSVPKAPKVAGGKAGMPRIKSGVGTGKLPSISKMAKVPGLKKGGL